MSVRRVFLLQLGAAVSAALWPVRKTRPVDDSLCHGPTRSALASPDASPLVTPGPSGLRHGDFHVVQHPTPRPGITGAKVLTQAQLAAHAELVPLFDGIRAIPEIADGIGCHCGCALLDGYYSLLSCYEGDAMAKICPICKGQGKLTVRLRAEGKSLDEIRVAVDAQFG